MTEDELLQKMVAPGTPRKPEDIRVGALFHALRVEEVLIGSRGGIKVRSRCKCGRNNLSRGYQLTSGLVKTCGKAGCKIGTIHGAAPKHGPRSPEYQVWNGLRERCNNPKCKDYPRYGGRGIAVCDRWDQFSNFLADVGPRPSPKHTIDRIDNEGDYEPGNVRWATVVEQANNRRSNVRLLFNGEEFTITQWARKIGLGTSTLHERLKAGWSVERALTTPAGLQGRKNNDRG